MEGGALRWNGEKEGEILNPGVFLFLVEVSYQSMAGPVTEVVTGDVTLVR
jgi:hypothetical protein